MTEARQPQKRRRSAIACINCHDRKVRCNLAFQGTPCSNCLQDRIACEVFGRKSPKPSPRRPIRPRLTEEGGEASILLTPSTQGFDTLDDERAASLRSHEGPSPIDREPDTLQRKTTVSPESRLERAGSAAQSNVVPYYAGESVGLEFLFDICAPNRALKGTHYIINRQVHKREHLSEKQRREPGSFPDGVLRQELLTCYFHYVHPFLPLVDVYSFFHKYNQGIDHVSPLLLWSMFFAAASFVSHEPLKRNRFSSRKSFKEYCYQHAREICNTQEEADKIALIQSAILLALWYVDLEDRDGTWHWLGVAISLCHTIGLHRMSNFDQVSRSPFSPAQRAIWKRLWWCVYYREAFAAMGFGRPMRISIDDCDLPVPTVGEILMDTERITDSVLQTYLPPDRERLASLWIHLLHLSMHVEHMFAMHYRPRRPLLSLSQMDVEDSDLSRLRDSAPTGTDLLPTTSLVHVHHLQCYFDAVTIAMYRPYVLNAPGHLTQTQQDRLRSLAQQRVKEAAADTTAAVNKLVSLDFIELASTMLVTAIMFAAQIHLFEIKQSDGLARQYASHHFNLHILVLSQLRRTYWTADQQHKLFTETLKAVENGELNPPATTTASSNPTAVASPFHQDHTYGNDAAQSPDESGLGCTACALEDIFLSFNPNPFISLPTDFDPGTPSDWVLGANVPLHLDPS